MSKRIGNVIIIAPEEDDKCELCGKIDELRPYGPNGERICYNCGMKNLETTQYIMDVKLFGVPPDESKLTKRAADFAPLAARAIRPPIAKKGNYAKN